MPDPRLRIAVLNRSSSLTVDSVTAFHPRSKLILHAYKDAIASIGELTPMFCQKLGSANSQTLMKQYPLSEISQDSWKALSAVFWKERLSCLPDSYAFDGIEPIAVETTKFGIHVTCSTWFLPRGDQYKSEITLSRPRFSSINDFIPKKLEPSEVRSSELMDDGSLHIEIA